MPEGGLASDNGLGLADTWFLVPVPLPDQQRGPGLFVVKQASTEYEIFRRYLFDWRTSLPLPFALLLNGAGEAVKVYAAVPSQKQVDADLAQLHSGTKPKALPFDGFWVKQPKRDYFKFGAAYLWAGLMEPAVPYLQRVLEQTPDNARVLVLMGQVQLETNQAAKAAQSFARAAQLDPNAVNAFVGLGDVAAKAGNSADAAALYGKALALDPRSAEAANGLGLALAKLGKVQEAQQNFEKAITARPDYADAINNLAVLFMQQGKTNDAIAAWSYGIKVAPDEDILYLNLGRAYVSMGQNEKARVTMQQLLDRDSSNQTARRALQELSGR